MISSWTEQRSTWLLCALASVLACGCIARLADPDIGRDNARLAPVPVHQQQSIEGVYQVYEGNDRIGDTIVLRFSDGLLCMYANIDVIVGSFALMRVGPPLEFEGTVVTVRSGARSAGRLSALLDDASESVRLHGSLDGLWSIALTKVRPLSKEPFLIIAHRGGGRNSDRLHRSENSMEMVRYAEVLGANAIEIDVKRTRDHQLITFHDETFSPRTVQGSVLLGPVSAFTLQDIHRYGRLVNGEKIPTVEQVLQTVIDETGLEMVWLDVKDAEATDSIIATQARAIEYAASRGRSVRIVYGIPTMEVLNAYLDSPLRNTTPVLCELSPEAVRSLPTCAVWAPRWTVGIHQSEVDEMHARGIDVVTWTLDVREYMSQFLTERRLDGILTNYPSLLCGMYFSQPR